MIEKKEPRDINPGQKNEAFRKCEDTKPSHSKILFSEIKTDQENIVFTQFKGYTNDSCHLYIQTTGRQIYATDLNTARERLGVSSFAYLPQFSRFPGGGVKDDGVIYHNVTSPTTVNLFQVIDEMRGQKLRAMTERINHYRRIGDNALKNELKAKLPYITHTGTFDPRRKIECLRHPSFTYQLDIDKVADPQGLLAKIVKDEQLDVLFGSVSTSGNGVKCLLFFKDIMFKRDQWTPEEYRDIYHQLTDVLGEYFQQKYGITIDSQMKSICQPFFLFHSSTLFVNPKYSKWI
jgi:hypothetical protein